MQTDRDPVVCVNLLDAQAYVAWLNTKPRNDLTCYVPGTYRLPSEAEWEYGARAGQQTSRWWGTAPVGSFRPNQFGLYDIQGNVWELTEDCWNPSYDGVPSDGAARTSGDCEKRVIRSGGWSSALWYLRSAGRTSILDDHPQNFIGFRVAKTLHQESISPLRPR